MILAEKFSQKLNNLKSKKEIQDFFIYFDEFRTLSVKTIDGAIGQKQHPTHYGELSEGEYTIIWNDNKISTGTITTSSVGGFDEFINNAKKSARENSHSVFIPERGIYPMVRTYSKALADMIDVPEYILKLADILDEIDKMVGFKHGEGSIEIRDGVRYAYSSKNLDEYFPYTTFKLNKTFKNHFGWEFTSSDIPSIMKFQELFSFLGDIYNLQSKSKATKLKKGKYNIILTPKTFKAIFDEHIIKNLDGTKILNNQSAFTKDDFINKSKVLGTLSLSYDPLLNHKIGTYKFTHFGLKPQKQYFIKFGKLDTPVLNQLNYSEFGHKLPTISIDNFSNIKLEGLKKKTFQDIKKLSEKVIYIPDTYAIKKKNRSTSYIYAPKSLLIEGNKTELTQKVYGSINLIDAIASGRVELIEFIDGQFGALIKDLELHFT